MSFVASICGYEISMNLPSSQDSIPRVNYLPNFILYCEYSNWELATSFSIS